MHLAVFFLLQGLLLRCAASPHQAPLPERVASSENDPRSASTAILLSHNLVDKIKYSHGPRVVKTELTNAQRTSAQKSLVQAYLATVNGLGVETWLMHDGLLGWWWGKQVSSSSLLPRARRLES